MVKAFAIHGIHLLAAEALVSADGKVQRPARIAEHKAGTIVNLDAADFAELAKAGAVRKATSSDLALAQAAAAEDLDELDSEDRDDIDLSKLSKDELIALAQDRQIDLVDVKTKADLIAAIEAAARA